MSDFDRMLQEAHKQIVECLLKRDVVNGQKALMKHRIKPEETGSGPL